MKSTIFKLTNPIYEIVDNQFQQFDEIYKVPTLPAYAILNHDLNRNAPDIDGLNNTTNYEIIEDTIRIKNVDPIPEGLTTICSLTLFYAGIRDYSLLFPHINDPKLKERLGQFAEEADNALQNGSWMSFTIMAISAIEGLLFNEIGNKKLKQLIDKAHKIGILNNNEKELLHSAREVRNRVHAGLFEQPLADRISSTDLYVLYDQLIKKDWYNS
ncbi:MAG: hypothetical protein AB2653_01720 [Candidatus Thiodiazotropha endolucinida]